MLLPVYEHTVLQSVLTADWRKPMTNRPHPLSRQPRLHVCSFFLCSLERAFCAWPALLQHTGRHSAECGLAHHLTTSRLHVTTSDMVPWLTTFEVAFLGALVWGKFAFFPSRVRFVEGRGETSMWGKKSGGCVGVVLAVTGGLHLEGCCCAALGSGAQAEVLWSTYMPLTWLQ